MQNLLFQIMALTAITWQPVVLVWSLKYDLTAESGA